MEFKDIIKKLRKSRNMSQAQLAAAINKGESAIRMWEIGKSKPDSGTLVMLSGLFNCSVDFMLGRTEFINYDDQITRINSMQEMLDFMDDLREDEKKRVTDALRMLFGVIKTDREKKGTAKKDESPKRGTLDATTYIMEILSSMLLDFNTIDKLAKDADNYVSPINPNIESEQSEKTSELYNKSDYFKLIMLKHFHKSLMAKDNLHDAINNLYSALFENFLLDIDAEDHILYDVIFSHFYDERRY